jgi:hypothetical protein
MTNDEFWKLLEGLPKGEGAEEALAERLNKLEPEEIVSFQAHFDAEHARAYNWLLWAAAYIIDGGCSDDGFIDFRYGLISRGRPIFEAALADPDSLVAVASEDDDEGFIPNESFGYVASEVYEEKTGNELPRSETPQPSDPAGEEWDFDDEDLCAQKLPKLWEKFGE